VPQTKVDDSHAYVSFIRSNQLGDGQGNMPPVFLCKVGLQSADIGWVACFAACGVADSSGDAGAFDVITSALAAVGVILVGSSPTDL
jgi:hypothetical protein